MRNQTVGDRAVRRSARLPWDSLIDLLGNEDTLQRNMAELRDTSPGEEDAKLLELADKYLDGWRPDDSRPD